MVGLLQGTGLRFNDKANHSGVQTGAAEAPSFGSWFLNFGGR